MPDLLEELTRRLVAEFDPEQVILFGSHVWGAPHEHSDIDLYVIVSQSNERPLERNLRVRNCLSGTHAAIDVFVKTRAEFEWYRPVRASLEYKIAEEGRVLYERSKTPIRTELAYQGPA